MLDEVTRELLHLDDGRRWVVLEEGQIEGTLYEAPRGGRLRATESRQVAHVSETPWLAFTVGVGGVPRVQPSPHLIFQAINGYCYQDNGKDNASMINRLAGLGNSRT